MYTVCIVETLAYDIDLRVLISIEAKLRLMYCLRISISCNQPTVPYLYVTSRKACLWRASLLQHADDRVNTSLATPVCLTIVCTCQLVGCMQASLLHKLQHGMHEYIGSLHLVQKHGVQASGVLACWCSSGHAMTQCVCTVM